jgi:DNA-binding NarL/FixJ family response regulator
MIRIFLVDDQRLVCETLKTHLEVDKDFQVVGTANNGEKAIEQIAILKPDIVLIDIEMPGMDGLTATKIICERHPEVKVVVLSAYDDDNYLLKALRAGAKGYLLKNITSQELVNTIRSVHLGQRNIAPSSSNIPNLAAMQIQIEEMVEKYKKQLEETLEEVQAKSLVSNNFQEQFDKRCGELELLNESSFKQFRGEIMRLENDFSAANRNLSSQLNQQVDNLKTHLESQFTAALQEWSSERVALQDWVAKREQIKPDLDEFDLKYKGDLMNVVNPIRATVRDVDKQMRSIQSRSLISFIVGGLACSFSLWGFVANSGYFPKDKTIEQSAQNTQDGFLK